MSVTPAETGPMVRSWDEQTAPMLRALGALQRETHDAMTRTQIGQTLQPAFWAAVDLVRQMQGSRDEWELRG